MNLCPRVTNFCSGRMFIWVLKSGFTNVKNRFALETFLLEAVPNSVFFIKLV